MVSLSEKVSTLIEKAKSKPTLAAVARQRKNAIGVALSGSDRFRRARLSLSPLRSGQRAVGLVRVEWLVPESHDDDPSSFSYNAYLNGRGSICAREMWIPEGVAGVADLHYLCRPYGPLAGAVRQGGLPIATCGDGD